MWLDNPVFGSLQTLHRPLALGGAPAVRYPPEVAPFLAVAEPGVTAAALVEPGETVFVVGPRPAEPCEDLGAILQMVSTGELAPVEGTAIVPLGDAQRAAVLELTALVYPHFFRPQTMQLGRYFGFFDAGRLAAIIGERMGFPGWREISAVSTHPDFIGRGLARRLLAYLTNDLWSRGETPFLHVSRSNRRAVQLYEQNGFRVRAEVPFAALKRP